MEQSKLVIPPLYDRPGNIQRKLALMARCIADLKNTQDYYGGIFVKDPWFGQRIREAETIYAELEKALRESLRGLEPAEGASDEKIRSAGEYLIKKHVTALKGLAKGPEG